MAFTFIRKEPPRIDPKTLFDYTTFGSDANGKINLALLVEVEVKDGHIVTLDPLQSYALHMTPQGLVATAQPQGSKLEDHFSLARVGV